MNSPRLVSGRVRHQPSQLPPGHVVPLTLQLPTAEGIEAPGQALGKGLEGQPEGVVGNVLPSTLSWNRGSSQDKGGMY